MIYNLKKYRAINKFLTIDWNSNRYYNESIFMPEKHGEAEAAAEPLACGCFLALTQESPT